MHLQCIQGVDFRNYRTLSYSPAPRLNILTGPNGHGKTNLLEAIALLLLGRSFRGARAAEMPRWDAPGATVSGELCRGATTRSMRREVRRRDDGVWAVAGEGCAWARVVPFGWQDLAILNGMPQARRNFLDGFAGKLLPAHLTAHARYRQVLARRNHLLQSGLDARVLAERIDPWDEQLAAVGVEIIGRRRAAVAAIGRELPRIHRALGGAGEARVEYRGALGEADGVAEFRAALARRRGEEMRRGQTLVGPHRDDLVIEVDGRDMRCFGSRGQQRLLALALRLAETGPVAAAVGTEPILLLDDALSELDAGVQRRLLEHVEGCGQVFLSSAETTGPARAAAWWMVHTGRVQEMPVAALSGAA